MEARLYRRKPQGPVYALQWDGSEERVDDITREAGRYDNCVISYKAFDGSLALDIITPSGVAHANLNDWILFTGDGLYVSARAIFEKWYELVEEKVS